MASSAPSPDTCLGRIHRQMTKRLTPALADEGSDVVSGGGVAPSPVSIDLRSFSLAKLGGLARRQPGSTDEPPRAPRCAARSTSSPGARRRCSEGGSGGCVGWTTSGQGRSRNWLRLHEKGGKRHDCPGSPTPSRGDPRRLRRGGELEKTKAAPFQTVQPGGSPGWRDGCSRSARARRGACARFARLARQGGPALRPEPRIVHGISWATLDPN